jgi:hypothetical protein
MIENLMLICKHKRLIENKCLASLEQIIIHFPSPFGEGARRADEAGEGLRVRSESCIDNRKYNCATPLKFSSDMELGQKIKS